MWSIQRHCHSCIILPFKFEIIEVKFLRQISHNRNSTNGFMLHYPLIVVVIQLLSHAQLFTTSYARVPYPPLSPRVCSSSCPLSRWCYLTISFFDIFFSFCLQSFPASESFPVSQLFTLGGQSIGVSASTSVLPMNIQDWFPLELTDFISLQSTAAAKSLQPCPALCDPMDCSTPGFPAHH